jgi:penicillin-binding protein 2A
VNTPVSEKNHTKPKTTNSKSSKRKPKRKKRWIVGLSITLILAVFAAISLYLVIMFAGEKMLQENINRLTMDQATIIYDKDGKELTSVYRQNREIVKYNEIPQKLKDAFVAVEDKRFFEHTGFDVRAVMRALYRDLVQRSAKEGGSTITQQLAKNMFLTSDKTLFRKVRELSLSLALENNYSKDQIIEMYLNNIYFGKGAYGVKTASKLYFNKANLYDLEIWEMATLAAIPKAPTKYSPLNDAEQSKMRRNIVLKLMADQNYITETERQTASQVEYKAENYSGPKSTPYMTFMDYVFDEVTEVYGISEEELLRSGYKIYTTLDQHAQKTLEDEFANPSNFPKDGPEQKAQGAMIIINHKTGEIAAMIGGRDYVAKGLNRVLVRRQPGSSFKPIVSYAPALEAGRNPYSMISDVKRSFGNNTYRPKNYDGVYRGKVDMFEAMRLSINIPAVNLLEEYGVDNAVNLARKMGVNLSDDEKNLTIALGGLTYGVTPLEMARAYGAFANNGEIVETHSVTKVLDSVGEEVTAITTGKARELSVTKAVSSNTSYIMTELLEGVVKRGTGRNARIDNWAVAGKTGTTQANVSGVSGGNRDAWFVGYTPEYTAAIWMGFDKTNRQHYLRESSGVPASMFSKVMSKVLKGKTPSSFQIPPGVYSIDKYKKPKTMVSLTGSSTDQPSVRLQWSSTESNLNYRIYRKDEGYPDFSIISETMDLFYIDYDVIPGSNYSYYVEVIRPETSVTGEKSNTIDMSVSDSSETPPENNEPAIPEDGLTPELPTDDQTNNNSSNSPDNNTNTPDENGLNPNP